MGGIAVEILQKCLEISWKCYENFVEIYGISIYLKCHKFHENVTKISEMKKKCYENVIMYSKCHLNFMEISLVCHRNAISIPCKCIEMSYMYKLHGNFTKISKNFKEMS